MRKLILILSILLLSCAVKSSDNNSIDANDFNFDSYAGVKVVRMRYCDGCGHSGDTLEILFDDGRILKVWAYKYNMKIVR